jgi:hypothetical protein
MSRSCTDTTCSNDAAYAFWLGDRFSRICDPPLSAAYRDGDLFPFVCAECLERYERHMADQGEFVRVAAAGTEPPRVGHSTDGAADDRATGSLRGKQ